MRRKHGNIPISADRPQVLDNSATSSEVATSYRPKDAEAETTISTLARVAGSIVDDGGTTFTASDLISKIAAGLQVSDIVDVLTSSASDKPISAAQGKALAETITNKANLSGGKHVLSEVPDDISRNDVPQTIAALKTHTADIRVGHDPEHEDALFPKRLNDLLYKSGSISSRNVFDDFDDVVVDTSAKTIIATRKWKYSGTPTITVSQPKELHSRPMGGFRVMTDNITRIVPESTAFHGSGPYYNSHLSSLYSGFFLSDKASTKVSVGFGSTTSSKRFHVAYDPANGGEMRFRSRVDTTIVDNLIISVGTSKKITVSLHKFSTSQVYVRIWEGDNLISNTTQNIGSNLYLPYGSTLSVSVGNAAGSGGTLSDVFIDYIGWNHNLSGQRPDIAKYI